MYQARRGLQVLKIGGALFRLLGAAVRRCGAEWALVCFALMVGGSTPAQAARSRSVWWGKVTYVTDGDTLWVQPERGGEAVKIRLQGIDAPEICQAWGVQARDALAHWVLRQRVSVTPQRFDSYGRLVAQVDLQGKSLAEWMVTHGHAWSYAFKRRPGPYDAQQARAIEQKRGLFATPNPELPREFRLHHGPCVRH